MLGKLSRGDSFFECMIFRNVEVKSFGYPQIVSTLARLPTQDSEGRVAQPLLGLSCAGTMRVAELASEGRDATMEGFQAGRQERKEDLVIRQIRRRFGDVSKSLIEQIDRLTVEQLNELGEALFDFNNLADLKKWLAGH